MGRLARGHSSSSGNSPWLTQPVAGRYETAWAYTHVPRRYSVPTGPGELAVVDALPESWVDGFVDRMEARVEALASW